MYWKGLLGGSVVNNQPSDTGDMGSYPCIRKIPWRSLLQYSGLETYSSILAWKPTPMENPIDGGVWQATDHGFTKSWTLLLDSAWMYVL